MDENGSFTVRVCVKKLFAFFVDEKAGITVMNGKKCVEISVTLNNAKPYYYADKDHMHKITTFEEKTYLVEADENEIKTLVRGVVSIYCSHFDANFIVDDEKISDICANLLCQAQAVVAKAQ